ncbi:phospholipase D-like domain-containing protein [Marinobacterium zhoushanense]|nr:phospholipase D-like domain-containing protein [Marinobacterium zhoushanense]
MRRNLKWHSGNRVELLIDGDSFFPAMLSAIESARETLLLEIYLAASGAVMDRFIAALCASAERGVRVCLLFDHFGARDLRQSDRQRLSRAGVSLVLYNPIAFNKWFANFSRDHRKMLVIDQRLAFIGGTGLTDSYRSDLPGRPDTPWHEVMCRVEGPVVGDIARLFTQLWNRSCLDSLPLLNGRSQPGRVAGDALVRLLTSEGPRNQRIERSILSMTHNARQRVWICTAYFLPSFALRLALRRAARRGVDVRLVVSGPLTDHLWIHHASKRYYRRLLNAGVHIYEYQPRMLHAKLALIDDQVSIGSCNLDHWNLRWNLEANIEVREPLFSAEVEQMLLNDFVQSQEITAAEWAQRPWHRKIKELVWALISQWILRIR